MNWTKCVDDNTESFGNVLSGLDINTTDEVVLKDISRDTFCKSIAEGIRMMPAKSTYHDADTICHQFKSDLYVYRDSVANTEIAHETDFIEDTDFIWAGYSDENKEGTYIPHIGNFSLSETNLKWSWGEPNGDKIEQCAVLQGSQSNLLNDQSCHDITAWVTCYFDESVTFTAHDLSNILPEVRIDNHFLFDLDDVVDPRKYSLNNFDGGSIQNLNGTWTLLTKDNQKLMEIEMEGFPIGRREWKSIIGDYETKVLNLNACRRDEFGCDNGICIPKWLRCNQITDCPGFEDEQNCSMLHLSPGYSKDVPTANETEILNIDLQVAIKKIIAMNFDDGNFIAQFKMINLWQDKRLKFKNLQEDMSDNLLKIDEWTTIWIPDYIIFNTKHLDHTKSLPEDKHSSLHIELLDIASSEQANNDFYYDGSLVKVQKLTHYTVEMLCNYDWRFYPFDSQYCPIQIFLSTEKQDNLSINVSVSTLNLEYSTFSIKLMNTTVGTGKRKMVQVLLKFTRNLTPILLNTYLPTLILTIINQLTNYYIGQDMFEGIIMINATILMTLTSIFISVFNSLPKTTYIKLMDIWIIATFVYPFLIIITHSELHVLYRRQKKRSAGTIRILKRICRMLLPSLFTLFTFVYFFIGYYHYFNN